MPQKYKIILLFHLINKDVRFHVALGRWIYNFCTIEGENSVKVNNDQFLKHRRGVNKLPDIKLKFIYELTEPFLLN